MDRQRLLVVSLLGILVIACQLNPHHARKLGPFRHYKSLLVLHFLPGVHAASGGHSVVEDSPYMDSFDSKVLVNYNGDQDWADIEEEGEQEEEKIIHEPHPADELLQTHKADGTESYILGGY